MERGKRVMCLSSSVKKYLPPRLTCGISLIDWSTLLKREPFETSINTKKEQLRNPSATALFLFQPVFWLPPTLPPAIYDLDMWLIVRMGSVAKSLQYHCTSHCIVSLYNMYRRQCVDEGFSASEKCTEIYTAKKKGRGLFPGQVTSVVTSLDVTVITQLHPKFPCTASLSRCVKCDQTKWATSCN